MEDPKRKYLILSLKLLYVLPLIVTAIVLYMYTRLLSGGLSYHIVWPQLILLLLLIFAFVTYISCFFAKTHEKQTTVWLAGCINGLGWMGVCLFSVFKTFSFGIAFDDLVWYLIFIYMGLITYVNYRLYKNDKTEPVSEAG